MIRRIVVSNYRSLGRNVELELDGLTALVGQNGSGKSNTVDVLRFVSDCMHMGLEGAINRRHGISAVRRWSSGHPFDLSISVEVQGSHCGERLAGSYGFTLTGDRAEEYRVKEEEADFTLGSERRRFRVVGGVWSEGPVDLRPQVDQLNLVLPLVAGDERFRALAEALRRVAIYAIYPDTLREPQKYDPAKPMDRHGSNWVSILKDQDRSTWKSELVGALGQLTGDIVDLQLRPVGGFLFVQFEHRRADDASSTRTKWFDAAQESDGTLRVAGIVTALLQQPPLPVIGIEEPELTVHAGAIPLLYDFIQQASRSSQVILTTHSSELLDLLPPEAVRVVERRHGETSVAPMEPQQLAAVKAGLMTLGEILRAEGIRQHELFQA